MAKKSKSKKSSVGLIAAACSFLLAIAGVLLFALLPMVKSSFDGGIKLGSWSVSAASVTTYAGFGMIFGGTVVGQGQYTGSVSGSTTFEDKLEGCGVNVMALIAFICVCVGVIAILVSFFLNKKVSKLVGVIGGLAILAGGVLMFCIGDSTATMIATVKCGEGADAETIASTASSLKSNATLGIGTIIGGIVTCLGGVLGVAAPLAK